VGEEEQGRRKRSLSEVAVIEQSERLREWKKEEEEEEKEEVEERL
jgi:hypothetical protein